MNTTTRNDDANAIDVIYEWDFAESSFNSISVPEGKDITVSEPLTLEEREVLLDLADFMLRGVNDGRLENARSQCARILREHGDRDAGILFTQEANQAQFADLVARIAIERAMAGMPS